MEISEIVELVERAEELKPVVAEIIKAVKSYGPELFDLMSGLAIGSVDIRVACVKRFEELGFTRQDAIAMTMDQWYQFSKSLNNTKKNK